MEKNVFYQKCKTHNLETVAFDLDPLAKAQDRCLCLQCLANTQPYRQSKIIQDAIQKFKEMTTFEFNNKKNKITLNLQKLQNAQNQLKEFQEFFINNISESTKILNFTIQEEQKELNSLIEPQQEIQSEQDLSDLSNYINFGIYKNLNQINPKKEEQLDSIKQILDNMKINEHLQKISNSLDSIFTQNIMEDQDQVQQNLSNQQQVDQQKYLNLRHLCQNHKSEFTMICLELKQIKQRLFCQFCIQEQKQNKLTSLFDVNILWNKQQEFLQFKIEQSNQNKRINSSELTNQQLFNQLNKLIINQNNKLVKERNYLQFSILNKQLYQMDQSEIELVIKTLSQQDPMQDIKMKQLQIRQEDQKYNVQIQEQLHLQKQKLLQISLDIDEFFYVNDFKKKQNNKITELQFFNQIMPQFLEKYSKFQSQYQFIINHVKSQKQNTNQQYKCKRILDQLELNEKIQQKQKNLTMQNLQIQQKYQLINNHKLTINIVNNDSKLCSNSWFLYTKKLKFSNQFKHSSIILSAIRKIASTSYNNQIQAICLCDESIPYNGIFSIDFQIHKMYYIMIGICQSLVIKKDYKLDNHNSIGHGFYLLSNKGEIFSNHDSTKNQENLGFQFNEGDIINIEVNLINKQITWRDKVNILAYSLEFQSSNDLYFCCVLEQCYDKTNKVEII